MLADIIFIARKECLLTHGYQFGAIFSLTQFSLHSLHLQRLQTDGWEKIDESNGVVRKTVSR